MTTKLAEIIEKYTTFVPEMNHEVYIARRMKIDNERQKGSPSLTVAHVGIVLAVVVMILSIAIVLCPEWFGLSFV